MLRKHVHQSNSLKIKEVLISSSVRYEELYCHVQTSFFLFSPPFHFYFSLKVPASSPH